LLTERAANGSFHFLISARSSEDLQSSTTRYVLLRQDVYEQLTNKDYGDSRWTDEELELLAWEAGKLAGWEDMDEYDHFPEKQ
jgi:hypothetical protein